MSYALKFYKIEPEPFYNYIFNNATLKMAEKLTHGVNFTNILWDTFNTNFLLSKDET